MNNKLKMTSLRIASAVMAGALVSSAFIFSANDASLKAYAADANVQKYEDDIAALEQKQKELEAKINTSLSEANEAAQTIATYDNLVYVIEAKIDASEALVAELDVRIAETETAIAEHEAQIEATNGKFLERMRMAHEDGNVGYLDMLLNAEDISDFLSRMERVNAMLDYDKKLKEQYKTEKAALEQEKADLSNSKTVQQETLTQLEADKADAQAMSAKAASYKATLEANAAVYQQQYNEAMAAEKELDAQLTAYLKKLQEQNSSQVTATGEFMWPLPTGQGYISCYFQGKDPNGNAHRGMDVAISYGTPIYASNDGTVLKAEWHYSYGYYVLIDHGNGKSTLYAHCSSLSVSAGQTVSKGQVIGGVGSTGFSTGNHLHFEFRIGGQLTNPLNYVTKGC